MSDISGPPAPKDVQRSVQTSDKASQVAKDPQNTDGKTQDRQQSDSGAKESGTQRARDPAVSISASAAHLRVGQELKETVSKVDTEGRPVIVTETTTFALRPDAGLRPEDAVVLKVAETGKIITADLIQRNNHPVNPPTRLTLIITEIHSPHSTQQSDATIAQEAQTNQPYRAPISSPTKTETIIPDTRTVQQSTAKTAQQPLLPASEKPFTTAAQSAGIAKLLDAQQSAQANQIQNTLPVEKITTQANASTPQGSVGPGVGPAISAISSVGATAIIQVLDPSISQVSPTKIATVTQVSPLSAAHAVLLGTGGNLLTAFNSNVALSVVETNRGTYIAPSDQVSELTGELIRLDVGAAQTTTASTVSRTTQGETPLSAPAFSALLIAAEDGSYPQKVSVSFMNAETAAPQANTVQTATINTVQTQAAFLSPDGPKTDIRLITTAGDISLTIPSGQRPEVGDMVQIRWPADAVSQAASISTLPITPPPEMAPNIDATPAQSVAASSTGILSNWPALQESVVTIAANGNSAALGELQDKTMQGGGKLANSLLFFLAAAGRAGPRAWIGQQAENALQTNAPSLLKQLSSDIQQMANMANDRSGEWRTIMLPVDTRTGDIPLAALLVQQHPEVNPDDRGQTPEHDDKENSDNKRFILQVQFSVLGDIQLDGHIRQKQFDLTVRSAAHFNPQLQHDLKGLFDVSLAANGYAGMLSFEEQYPFAIDAQDVIEKKLLG